MPRSDFCNQRHDPSTRMNRSTPESPSSFAFAFEAGFHGRPPDRNLGDDVTSGGTPLDGGLPALVWPSMSSGFPRDPLRSDLWALDRKPSEQLALAVAFSAIGTVACQPLTLSVVLPSEEHQTRLHRRLVKGRRSRRIRAPGLASRAPSGRFRVPVKSAERRRLQSPRSTSTTAVSRAPFRHSPRLPS